jgi:DNA-directed RNA polymerase subunit M/transcription elongation factor TFIIS
MSTRLVTIRNFACSPDPVSEAQLARIHLESENIPCFLAGEHFVGMYWLCSFADHGVKLQVRHCDMARARAALESGARYGLEANEEGGSPEMRAPRCPNCGSVEVSYERYSRPFFYFSLLLLRFPLPYLKGTYRCDDCGHTWKQAAPCGREKRGDTDPGGHDGGQ